MSIRGWPWHGCGQTTVRVSLDLAIGELPSGVRVIVHIFLQALSVHG